MSGFTVVICTHNRAALLAKVLDSLHQADVPAGGFDILVIANACSDRTAALLEDLAQRQPGLRWLEEPTPGKSHALNLAVKVLESPAAVFVDDDHRVPSDFLVSVQHALGRWPDAGMFCGRIRPDWDGTEPEWVHERGPYPILPRPIPAFNAGDEPHPLPADGVLPGGGNLIVRKAVFESVGSFDTKLGPSGHDLGGAEDVHFIRRALAAGFELRYDPAIVQYHAVNKAHLRLGYLMRKGFQRSRAAVRIRPRDAGGVPAYLWRKVMGYAFNALLALPFPDRRRYYLVRLASALGEMQGLRDSTLRPHPES